MSKHYEIYVPGSSGFSAFVKTDKVIPADFEETILNLAVDAKVIEGGDAKEIFHGVGYVEERQPDEIHPGTPITEV